MSTGTNDHRGNRPTIHIKAIGLILFVHIIFERRLRRQNRLVDIPKLRSGTYSLFLVLLFLIYPSVSSTILSSFVCRTFDDGSRWLRKDITINCDSPDRAGWIALGSIGIIIYVIGIPFVYLISLVRVRREINPKDPKQTPDKRKFASVLFLTEIYKREYWYWEVIELIRKLVQTSLIIFFLDGSVMQMIVMIAVAMIMVQVINEIRPYQNDPANKLASIAQWQILIVSFIGLLLKVDLGALDAGFTYNKQELLTGFLVAACFMAPAFALFQHRRFVYRVVVKDRCGLRSYCRCSGAGKTTSNEDQGEEFDVIPFSSASVDYLSTNKNSRGASSGAGIAKHGMVENPIVEMETSKLSSLSNNTANQRVAPSSGGSVSGPESPGASRPQQQHQKVSFAPLDDSEAEEKRRD